MSTHTYAHAVAAELRKHPDFDGQRMVALAWIKVAVQDADPPLHPNPRRCATGRGSRRSPSPRAGR